jgi:hypothetical protein
VLLYLTLQDDEGTSRGTVAAKETGIEEWEAGEEMKKRNRWMRQEQA